MQVFIDAPIDEKRHYLLMMHSSFNFVVKGDFDNAKRQIDIAQSLLPVDNFDLGLAYFGMGEEKKETAVYGLSRYIDKLIRNMRKGKSGV